METIISVIAIVVSIISVAISIMFYISGVQRETKQSTLEAFNILQEQVFDNLNNYTFAEIKEICATFQNITSRGREIAVSETEKENEIYHLGEYRKLSGYLARIEHFALGVNTGIYDSKIAERAGTAYLSMLYTGKLKPLIELKHIRANGVEYYAEFRVLVDKIQRIESRKK